MTLARRADVDRPGIAATAALLSGSFAPLLRPAAGIAVFRPGLATMLGVGGDATPIFAGPSPYLLLAVLVMVALPPRSHDPERGFSRAAIALCPLAAIYPFFIPTFGLAAGFSALLWTGRYAWRRMFRGVAWFYSLSGAVMLYWTILPYVDGECARFAKSNWAPLFSPACLLVNLGVGLAAILGLPRLLKGNPYQQMLACFAVAFITALYIPAHPWRSHTFYLSPVLVIAAFAAWSPNHLGLPNSRKLLVLSCVAATLISLPYYYARNVRGLLHFAPPFVSN
jgi:hypothetical protein